MNRLRIYFIIAFSAAVLLTACSDNSGNGKKKMPDLSESFSNTDKKPFGTFIAYHELEEMFYRNTIRDERRNFEDSWKYLEDTGCVYICISHSLYSTDQDVEGLLNFVKNGNDAFFAVEKFDNNLLVKLNCRVSTGIAPLLLLSGKPYRTSGVKMRDPGKKDSSLYEYFYLPLSNSFTSYDTTLTKVLGVNESGEPNFIVMFEGKGRIFLHCEPRAFSNYFLLQKNNYEYLQKAFGYVRPYPDHVYWNNYYVKLHSKAQAERRRGSGGGGSGGNGSGSNDPDSFNSLSEIMSHPSLATAFWLALILLLLYILFGLKRRQRIIEMIKPNDNTTVTFTETVGRLYLQKKDNKNIADKMVTYFNEYIRNNYFLNTNLVNTEFMSTLSRKSGVPFEKVETLYRSIGHSQHAAVIDDYELLSLNEQIQNFYKTRN